MKFDLRVYVIVTGKTEGKMNAFLADEAIARFCTVVYKEATSENINNKYMHITNYNINKFSKNCIDEEGVEDVLKPNSATKRTLSAVLAEIDNISVNKDASKTIRKNIQNLCKKTMAALMSYVILFTNPSTEMQENYAGYFGKPFEIIGLDILIDSNLKAWLIEINKYPGMDFMNCNNPHKSHCNHTFCQKNKVDCYVKK